jgi:SAM-dependent methyltransferase
MGSGVVVGNDPAARTTLGVVRCRQEYGMTDATPPQAPAVDALNAEQASAWNGEEGEDWAARPDRYDAASRRYDAPLIAGARITPADRVLDVGCGAGISTRAAARVAVDGSATGIDLSAPRWPRRAGAARPRG